jgi:hypothetical protein
MLNPLLGLIQHGVNSEQINVLMFRTIDGKSRDGVNLTDKR